LGCETPDYQNHVNPNEDDQCILITFQICCLMEDDKQIETQKGPQLYTAPIVRFALELLTWIILIVVGYWYVTVILILLLSQLNFPANPSRDQVAFFWEVL